MCRCVNVVVMVCRGDGVAVMCKCVDVVMMCADVAVMVCRW